MDEKTFIDVVAKQIEAWKELGKQTLPANHPAILSLTSTEALLNSLAGNVNAGGVDTRTIPAIGNRQIENPHAEAGGIVDTDEDAVRVPNGFADEEAYHDFLASQTAVIGDSTPDDVVGVVVDVDGNATEVGDFDASMARVNGLIADVENQVEYDEETGDVVEERHTPIRVENLITVEYTRLDGQELSQNDVNEILAHPVSRGLERFGAIEQVDVRSFRENPSVKCVDFIIDSDDLNILKGMALDAVQYRGVHVFPGIGQVQAVGSVDIDGL